MNTEPQTRREFLQAAVRATMLGAVGVVGAVLFRRRQNCATRGGCGGCKVSEGCSLPWKEAKK